MPENLWGSRYREIKNDKQKFFCCVLWIEITLVMVIGKLFNVKIAMWPTSNKLKAFLKLPQPLLLLLKLLVTTISQMKMHFSIPLE